MNPLEDCNLKRVPRDMFSQLLQASGGVKISRSIDTTRPCVESPDERAQIVKSQAAA